MSKLISFNESFLDRNGNQVDNKITLSDVLSDQLMATKGENANESYKMYDWAILLSKEGKITIDSTDAKMLYEKVEKMPLTNLVIVPILRIIETAK